MIFIYLNMMGILSEYIVIFREYGFFSLINELCDQKYDRYLKIHPGEI